LAEDVILEMPPVLNWFSGREKYGQFMDWVFEKVGTDWRLEPLTANGQPGFAAYWRVEDGYHLHTVQIFTVTTGGISRNSVFQEREIFAAFALPLALDIDGQPTA
jgi:RNA polymerase sigma-70 factor (ECF subfamily)